MLRWEDGDRSGGTLEGTGISTDGTPNRCRLSAGIMSGWKQHQCRTLDRRAWYHGRSCINLPYRLTPAASLAAKHQKRGP
ncbi:hypothetical protein C0Q70_04590 [Pomacea canaliculata]|uniref:Uncharacterized protein n=1 Tax=Pomacea canaliculata TaxID=400727 RepID=A0A2T7PIS9_POMCA|nr:hypothetical protein C0Q70_04590 [Pomacea canaliculata]